MFVSSTCYDLSQIRLDLKRFIEGQGYDAVISESSAFPVNPQATAVENCINAVRDRADILVLIVGTRYGSTPVGEGDRSITNLEYLEARAKGIPIYVFMSKELVHSLAVWRKNKQNDFSSIVDNPKVFEFADHLRTESKGWAFDFNEAADIERTLRQQWAILFNDAMEIRKRVQGANITPDLLELPPKPLSILLKKPQAWEYRFFAEVLRDELQKLESLRLDLKYGLQLDPIIALDGPLEFLAWIGKQFTRAIRLGSVASNIMNTAIQEALGPTGVEGDAALMVYVARKFAEVVKESLQWRCDFLAIKIDDEFRRLAELASGGVITLTEKMEAVPDLLDSEIDKALEAKSRGENYVANVHLVLESSIPDSYYAEMRRIERLYGVEVDE